MKIRTLISIAYMALPALAFAQSISVEDLQRQIDAEMNKPNPYAALLSDPDPKRAQTAMKLMLESKDAALVDLALEFGLFSPDKSVRNQALRGYLDTLPRLDMFFDGSKANEDRFANDANYHFRSGVNPDKIAIWTPKIESYSASDDAYQCTNGSCFIQVREDSIRFWINGTWHEVTLTDEGYLIGAVDLNYSKAVPMRIKLR